MVFAPHLFPCPELIPVRGSRLHTLAFALVYSKCTFVLHFTYLLDKVTYFAVYKFTPINLRTHKFQAKLPPPSSLYKVQQDQAVRKMKIVTAKTSVNIAVIKYWGKADEKLIIPINDSISGTLDSEDLCTTTTVATDASFSKDEMWLNGQPVDIQSNGRLVRCLSELRAKCQDKSLALTKIRIASVNDFPTAAGLASSAAGYAALIYALGHLYGITNKSILSIYARMGSGSAIRSLDGGFVHWITGTGTSETSVAKQIASHEHWPEMRVLILVTNDAKKETASTDGMKRSVETSSLLPIRASKVVPERISAMTKAILEKDFQSFAELTMKDSNQFHAIAQDTYPPLKYMNETSWKIVKFVHGINNFYGKSVAAYTFDAGPNACIYLLQEMVQVFLPLVLTFFPFSNVANCTRGHSIPESIANDLARGRVNLDSEKMRQLEQHLITTVGLQVESLDSLKYIIATRIGRGAEIDSTRSLLDDQGNPI